MLSPKVMSSSDTLRPVRDALLCETQEDMDRLDAHHSAYGSRALTLFTGRHHSFHAYIIWLRRILMKAILAQYMAGADIKVKC
jgi:hypothetical protein